MILIYGSRWYFRGTKAATYKSCDQCGQFSRVQSFNGTHCAHLYFIPLIPMVMRARVHQLCSKCDLMVQFKLEDFAAAEQAIMTAAAEATTALLDGEFEFVPVRDSDLIEQAGTVQSSADGEDHHGASEAGGQSPAMATGGEPPEFDDPDHGGSPTDDPSAGEAVNSLSMLQHCLEFLHSAKKKDVIAQLLSQFAIQGQEYAYAMVTAMTHLMDGRFNEAISAWTDAAGRKPEEIQARTLLAWALHYKKRYEEAAHVYGEIAERSEEIGSKAYALRQQAEAFLAAKNFRESARAFDRLFEVVPSAREDASLKKAIKKAYGKSGLPMPT